MILNIQRSFIGLLMCCVAPLVAPFEVRAPNEHLVAVGGHSAVLGCEFTPDPDLSNLVVTWQRKEDSQVVHSFYYQQNQLDRQSPEYHNRTSLFISELGKGNGSLKLETVGLKDAGGYMCIVSTAKGTAQALVQVSYGALYSEPRLSIHLNSSTVTVKFETEGFPEPEVNWLGEQGQNLSHYLEVNKQTKGLYSIKSSYEAQKPAVNVTFTLKNHLLNQNLQRPVILIYDEDTTTRDVTTRVVVYVMVFILLFTVIICLTVYWHNKHKSDGLMISAEYKSNHITTSTYTT